MSYELDCKLCIYIILVHIEYMTNMTPADKKYTLFKFKHTKLK